MRSTGYERTYAVCSITHGDRRAFIEENVESVAGQYSGGDFTVEHVVLDNASTDDTARYLRRVEKQYPHLRVLYEPEPIPLGAARNLVFQQAASNDDGSERSDLSYIVPLDGDDRMLQRGIFALDTIAHDYVHQLRIESLQRGETAPPLAPLPEVVFGIPMIVDAQNRPTDHPTLNFRDYTYAYQLSDFMEVLYLENRLVTGTVAIAPEAVRRAGGWDENPQLKAEDWGFWLNLFATTESYYFDEARYISAYRIHSGQSSQMPGIDADWERDGYYLRRQLLQRYAGTAALSGIQHISGSLLTDEYLGSGAKDFIRSVSARGESVANIAS